MFNEKFILLALAWIFKAWSSWTLGTPDEQEQNGLIFLKAINENYGKVFQGWT